MNYKSESGRNREEDCGNCNNINMVFHFEIEKTKRDITNFLFLLGTFV